MMEFVNDDRISEWNRMKFDATIFSDKSMCFYTNFNIEAFITIIYTAGDYSNFVICVVIFGRFCFII